MKMTQAWGWLTAGVLAAGLNASYHNGGLQWAHQAADRLEGNSQAVLALASGQARQVLSETGFVTRRNETASCPLSASMARVQSSVIQSKLVQSKLDRSQATFDRIEAMSARQQARWEANQVRMETRIAAHTAHIRMMTADFAPGTLRAIPAPVVCPRIRISVPRLPRIEIPAVPDIHIEMAGSGPV
jgi:light-regulated signal transduction histidine kinase (bacteriophytochrome)